MGIIQHAGKESALPKASAKTVSLVEITGVRAKHVTQGPSQGTAVLRGRDEMKMIGHQAVREVPQGVALRCFPQKVKEHPAILIIEEYIFTPVPSLRYVVR